jgi:hypothetical protein
MRNGKREWEWWNCLSNCYHTICSPYNATPTICSPSNATPKIGGNGFHSSLSFTILSLLPPSMVRFCARPRALQPPLWGSLWSRTLTQQHQEVIEEPLSGSPMTKNSAAQRCKWIFHPKAVCNTSIASCTWCPLDRPLVGVVLFLWDWCMQ